MITLPAKVKWNDYQKELDAVADGLDVLNFRIPSLPKESGVGARCYVCHKGCFVGYMIISGFVERQAFTCSTSGEQWAAGKYVQRTGRFYPMNDVISQPGFQGWRYFR